MEAILEAINQFEVQILSELTDSSYEAGGEKALAPKRMRISCRTKMGNSDTSHIFS